MRCLILLLTTVVFVLLIAVACETTVAEQQISNALLSVDAGAAHENEAGRAVRQFGFFPPRPFYRPPPFYGGGYYPGYYRPPYNPYYGRPYGYYG